MRSKRYYPVARSWLMLCCIRRKGAFGQHCASNVDTRGGAAGLASRVPVECFWLADRGTLVSVPGPARRLGHPGHLLFEPAVARAAAGVGGGVCGLRGLGVLAVAPPLHAGGRVGRVSRRGRVVDIHSSLAQSQLAGGYW